MESKLAERGRDVVAAATDLHHHELGPGAVLEAEWTAAGLTLPNVEAMRDHRVDRIQRQLLVMGYDGAILMDPMNIRYATDSTNMQVWVMHNPSRYVWVGADGSMIVWEFFECDFLSSHNTRVQEVRPAIGSIYFLAGPRYREKSAAWTAEMVDVISEHCGAGARIAVDRCGYVVATRCRTTPVRGRGSGRCRRGGPSAARCWRSCRRPALLSWCQWCSSGAPMSMRSGPMGRRTLEWM